MKTITLLGLICLVAVVSSTYYPWEYPYFNPYKYKINEYDNDYLEFFIPCEGGSGKYHYRYYDLPARWDYRGDKIYVPVRHYSLYRRYSVKVSVYDVNYRVYLKRTLVFSFVSKTEVRIYIRPYADDSSKDKCYFPSDNKL